MTQAPGDEPLRFSNEAKLRKQMHKRGWTDEQIREAMRTAGVPARGKVNPATRYVHPVTGKSVVVDAVTGEIFHVGGEGFVYED
jgi:hypothetical protein